MTYRFIALLTLFLSACATPTRTGKINIEHLVAESPAFHTIKPAPNDVSALRAEIAGKSGFFVRIFFGAWCHDSQRDVPRMIGLLNALPTHSLTYELYALDTNKSDSAGLAHQQNITRTPTYVVYYQEREIGRIIERPKLSLARDLQEIIAVTNGH